MPRDHADYAQCGQKGGYTGWANTEDRDGRMAHVRANSPTEIAWHAKKLGFDPENLTEAQRKRAESARGAYYADLGIRGRAKRKRKAKQAEPDGGGA